MLSMILLSPLRDTEVAGDIVSSALYVANWHFAAQSVDYFAQGLEPSPVLHLWSLAIEEQFYLVWPGLILATTWLWRRRGRSVRPVLWVVLALILAGSLVYGIVLTGDQPAFAYFSTFARAWELALGAAIALAATVKMPRLLAVALGWAGVAAIVYACFAFTGETQFPGTAALVPTLGAAALILSGSALAATVAGVTGGRLGAANVLGLRPVRYVGRISYSWYLWHWPAIVFAAAIWGPRLSVAAGLAAVAASWIPTQLTHMLIEDPVRRAPMLARLPNRALALGLACTVVALGVGIGLKAAQPTLAHGAALGGPWRRRTARRTDRAGNRDGAAAQPAEGARRPRQQLLRRLHGRDPRDQLQPVPLRQQTRRQNPGPLRRLARDAVLPHGRGTGQTSRLALDRPDQGRMPAGGTRSEEHGRRPRILAVRRTAPGRARTDRNRRRKDDRDHERGHRIHPLWAQRRRTVGGRGGGSDGSRLPADAEAHPAVGPRTVVIRDNPTSTEDVPSCVSEDIKHLGRCSFPRRREWDREYDVRAAERSSETHLVSFIADICPGEICRAVIGNALTYRDKDHLTATFARTLEPMLESDFREAGLAVGGRVCGAPRPWV